MTGLELLLHGRDGRCFQDLDLQGVGSVAGHLGEARGMGDKATMTVRSKEAILRLKEALI